MYVYIYIYIYTYIYVYIYIYICLGLKSPYITASRLSVLQRVAVCCSVLQRVAVCCSVLQRLIAASPLPPPSLLHASGREDGFENIELQFKWPIGAKILKKAKAEVAKD